MRRAPPTCKQVKAALKSLGFEKVKPRKGTSHEKFRHPEFRKEKRNVTVDCPKAPFRPELIISMARQAGLKKNEFWDLCLGRIKPEDIHD
ncbi:type II toxin-antitoxin system HicA family toxin [Alloalcanivorax venustensis]|jgi:predicted RNA binding protein YcfA (HicA-like mRNA interferase family)|uniref:type II toxin-antitoxin system HicA family toxin n=1 Tax=Alloalcanivorax venustensis TaxID=172371 RepID=UPI0035182669